MKFRADVFAVVMLLLFLTILVSVVTPVQASSAESPGEKTFVSRCTMCHGADGAGKTMMGEKFKVPDFHSEEVQKKTDAELTQIITDGKGKMAPYKGKLTSEQITQVVVYIRELGKKK